jgi:2-keto-3-deoxy-L-fuconate dehydrogenase
MFSLTDKVAVVTGGGSGIGQAIAELFARQGATVHILERDPDAAQSVVATINEAGGRAFAHTCDVSQQASVLNVFRPIKHLDILVNNAGIAHVGRLDATPEAEVDKVLGVNVKGVYNCLYAAIPILQRRGGGVILNMSSIAARVGIPDRFAYSMSKGAVHAMTLSVARDYLTDNIRCNSMSPARVHTPFVDGFLDKNYAANRNEMFDKLSKSQPIGRMGTPDEIAALALYLCSNEAGFVSGCDYPIDGGFVTLNN